MFCIGGAILLAMLVLMAVVICLYYKVANALNLQCCDECNLYPGFDALPPCCCNVNEGL
ncbi:protein FAM24B [Dama dama]|uniref:protein FAM24B n=1 Tax=Dama dama TaxID=30532 RepID=UPI002A369F1F|nr:protein FAM24B [Dama dama]